MFSGNEYCTILCPYRLFKLFAEGNYNDDINNNNNENSIILTYMLRERFEYRDYFTVNYATM